MKGKVCQLLVIRLITHRLTSSHDDIHAVVLNFKLRATVFLTFFLGATSNNTKMEHLMTRMEVPPKIAFTPDLLQIHTHVKKEYRRSNKSSLHIRYSKID